jgi:hypothetical protein
MNSKILSAGLYVRFWCHANFPPTVRNFFRLQKCRDKWGKQTEMRIHLIVCYCSRNASGYATVDLSSLYARGQSAESISEVGWKGIRGAGSVTSTVAQITALMAEGLQSLADTGHSTHSQTGQGLSLWAQHSAHDLGLESSGIESFLFRKATICPDTTTTTTTTNTNISTYANLLYTFLTIRFKLELVCHCSARCTSPFYIGDTYEI